MFKLRPYQLKAVEFCTQKLAERKNSLLVAATGAGKTIMLSAVAQWICRQGTGKVYVVVGRDKINQQNIEKFRKVVPEYPASEFSGRMKSTHGRVIFLTVQTAIGHYMKLPRPMAVIFDETHHARADSYETLLKFWKPDMVFGATATPERGDGKSLGSLFDNFYQISARQLIDMNYLSKPEFHNFNAVCEIPRDADKATRNTYIAAISVDMANAFRELPRLPGKSIVFCRNHDIAGLVCTILTGVGEKVAYIKSGDSANESEMDRFLTGKAQWLVNVDIATEGFDDPYIMNVFNLCSDGTRGRWVQKIGRGLRPHQHKTICRVFDCGGNIDTYGDLDFTECLPVAAEKDKSGVLRILDLWRDSDESEKQIEMAMPEFNAGGTFTPYAAPDGWFSFYDPDYETVFLRNDGRFAKLPDGREVAIRQDATFELDDIELPKVAPSNKGINSWQLGQLTDIPTFGLEKAQADAVLAWKSWKSKQKNKKTNA